MKWRTTTNITKTSLEVLPGKVPSVGVFDVLKMIAELLLVFSLHLVLFFIWYWFRHLINIIASDEDVLIDVVDTPREGIEQHKKREELKDASDKGKLGHKCTHRRVDKESDEIINKTYAEYKTHELKEKGEKTRKPLGKHVINLYSTGIYWWLKIKDVKKLRQDIENDPIIKGQMANLGCLFVCTFGNYLSPILIAAHTTNSVDFGAKPEEGECYESEQ